MTFKCNLTSQFFKGAFLCSQCRAKLHLITDWALQLICFKRPQVHLDVIEEIGLITRWSNETPPIGYGYTSHWITNRRVLTTLNFEVMPREKPFLWKWVIFAWEYKIVSHLRFHTYNYLTQLWDSLLSQLKLEKVFCGTSECSLLLKIVSTW